MLIKKKFPFSIYSILISYQQTENAKNNYSRQHYSTPISIFNHIPSS